MSRRQAVSPCGCRVKNAITATDVSVSKMTMPSPPVTPSQKKSLAIGSWPVAAKKTITARPVALWGQRCGLGNVVRSGPAERCGQDILPAEGVGVAPAGVVERQRGSEQRGQEQELGGLAERAAAEAEQQSGTLLCRGGHHVPRSE